MTTKTIKIAAIGFMSIISSHSFSQIAHNLYPYAEAVVSDNNGRDLVGFVKSNKAEFIAKSAKVNEFSQNKWGYIQVTNSRVPSINIHPTAENKKVDLNYSEMINATVALFGSKDAIKATWWARQANNPEGPVFYKKVKTDVKIDAELVRYEELSSEMYTKDFTIVDYNDSVYNDRDYTKLLKNYVIIDNSVIRDNNDYKGIIDFFNNFLSKFTYTDDPLLEGKSFITCLTIGKTNYIGYFNIINHKLGGHLQIADIKYETDKDLLVNGLIKKLTGKTIYVYGDNIFGLEKTFLKYGHTHPALKLIRRETNSTEKFNTKEK
jgi:hypothetical protein